MYRADYKFLLIVCVVFALLASVETKKKKKLKCFQCANVGNIDCDFLDYIVFNARWLKPCENTTQCQVSRVETAGYPHITRSCKLPEGCPKGAKCCFCSKKGCNGNNRCNFNAATKWNISKLYMFMIVAIGYTAEIL